MTFCKLLAATSLTVALAAGCGKKSDDDAAATPPAGQAATVAAAYSTISTSAGKLNVVAYKGTSLTDADEFDGLSGGDSLGLADETWTNTEWNAARFNCYGTCSSGSPSGKQYVADALNKDKPGPMGTVTSAINSFCYVGALLPTSGLDASTGIPIIGAYAVTLTDAMSASLSKDCGMSADNLTQVKSGTISIDVAASSSTLFDRLVTFNLVAGGKTNSFPLYFKNSGGKVGVGQFSATGTAAAGVVTRSILMQDVATNVFRMEYFSRDLPASATAKNSDGITGGSYSFYRGFYDKTAGEVRFLSNMGNSYYQLNNSWVALSSNDTEAQSGAFLSRTSNENTALTGAFVCFKKADGTFVNATGCTENAANSRKVSWSADSTMWKAVNGKGFADWSASPVDIAAFDATTMFTLEPNYK